MTIPHDITLIHYSDNMQIGLVQQEIVGHKPHKIRGATPEVFRDSTCLEHAVIFSQSEKQVFVTHIPFN